MYITATIMGGEDIDTVCQEACALAARVNCDVHFSFNGVTCMAFPHSRPKDLVAAWREAIGSDRTYKIAAGHLRG